MERDGTWVPGRILPNPRNPVCLLQYAYPESITLGLGGSSGDRGSYFSIFWLLNRGLSSTIILEPLALSSNSRVTPFPWLHISGIASLVPTAGNLLYFIEFYRNLVISVFQNYDHAEALLYLPTRS